MTDDELLMEYLRTKDNGLFTTLYDRMHDGLCAVARRIAPRDADDVVQDAFCKLCRLEPQEVNAGFMVKMVQNLAICRNRRRKHREVSLDTLMRPDRDHEHGDRDELVDDGDSPDVQLEKKECLEEIEAVIDFLPPDKREVIDSYYERGQTIAQTAEDMGVDPEAAWATIRRGVEDLSELIVLARRRKKVQEERRKKPRKKPRPYPRPIRALDPESGAVVREFARLYDALAPGDSRSGLYRALRQGRIYKGLKWSYASAT